MCKLSCASHWPLRNWWLTRQRRCSLNSLLPCDMEHRFCLTILYCCTLTLNCHDKLSRNQVPLHAVHSLLLLTSNNLGFVRWPIQSNPHRITRWFKWGLFETNSWFLISMQFGIIWFTTFLTFILYHFFLHCLQS